VKKKYFFIILALGVFLNLLYYLGAHEPLKKFVPPSIINFVKNTILYIPAQLKKKEAELLIYENLAEQTVSLQSRVNELESLKDAINNQVFPKTEFVELEYVSHNVHSMKQKEVIATGEITSPFYLEIFDNNLIISSKIGKFFYFPINSLLSKKKQQIVIKHNLKKNIEITDLLVHNDKLFVAYYDRDIACGNFSIFEAKINFEYLEFKKFYKSIGRLGECPSRDTVAGRIVLYENNSQIGLLATVSNIENVSVADKNMMDQFGISKENKFSGLIFINLKSKKSDFFATGFRNPQGLLVTNNNNILTSEHGPRGGDEINNILFSKNYGWPESSYGENYRENFSENEKYKFKKNHQKHGYVEPVFAFVPSIAPSQLIEIDENFSKKWNKTILLSTLKGKSLYRLTFDESYSRIITYEKIFVGKRIRDIIYSKNNRMIFLAEESENPTISLISVKNK
jgi:hypothetical protein